MMKIPRYLTKSRFQSALECPTKLYYYGKKKYPSTKDDDEFLAALARCYYPGGIDIKTLEHEKSLQETSELLKQDNVTIFEAAIKYDNLFIRVDILEKKKKQINLIEVKAKSVDPHSDSFMTGKGKYIAKDWMPYLSDVAFQTWVMSGDINPETLGVPILTRIPVRYLVEKIWNGNDRPAKKKSVEDKKAFEERIKEYARYYRRDEKYPVTLGRKCKDCEYNIKPVELKPGQCSGYRECWSEWDEAQFAKPHIFEIWDYRQIEKDITDGIYLMEDLRLEEQFMKPDPDGVLRFNKKTDQRKHLQISKAINKNYTEEIDPELFLEMNTWQYPLHFIDFETSMVAIPFTKDRRPYEQTAFQFSCHTVHENGQCDHQEWISEKHGYFPNFEFITELKKVLDKDEGTIFRYAPHENTVLRQIQRQLLDARDAGRGDLPDNHKELIEFIDTITEWEDEDTPRVYGPRNMVDLLKMVRDYYYHPAMGGSNSIKSVLPAVMQASPYLREKYSNPQPTTNSGQMVWWQLEQVKSKKEKVGTKPKDPYQLLGPLYEDIDLNVDELILESNKITEGGAAMIAYARMQFTEMQEKEREAIIRGLLKYCELDTLAMVMIWEHWKHV
jgi:predicted Zn-ribbon and HTH transcriptional regulator